MIDDSFRTRINATLTHATAIATSSTRSMPKISFPHPLSGVSTNDATTRHNVVNAPTDTSKARTINALVWPIAASANGIVATSRLFNVKLERKAGLRELV